MAQGEDAPCERRTGADGARQPPPSPPPSTLTVGPYSSLFDLWAFVRLLLLCLCLLTMATSSYMMLVPADSIWWLCCFGPQDVHHFVQGMEEHLQIN